MKILFIGDYKANSGPSNVNKNLKKYLPSEVSFIKSSNAVFKCMELIFKVTFSKIIVISGFSRFNLVCLKFAKLLNKKTIYILHGCASYENKINELNNDGMVIMEENCYDVADCILCVSESFMYWFKKHYPHYSKKTFFLNNGIDWEHLKMLKSEGSEIRDQNTLITMGGGRPQKNNLIICEAIKLLNSRREDKFKLIVLGRDYRDTEKIKSYDFVDYIGQVEYNEVFSLLKRSKIFIQNSSFESFGLAPMEALLSGCDILVSKNVGAICIMKTLKETDIINDCTDSTEIAMKIEYLLNNTNNARLLDGIDRNKTSCEYAANRLMQIIGELVTKGNIHE